MFSLLLAGWIPATALLWAVTARLRAAWRSLARRKGAIIAGIGSSTRRTWCIAAAGRPGIARIVAIWAGGAIVTGIVARA